ncbi:hypothetical protein [Psychrilyobacter atlanticus]|uniref:hypothetical protein n=1 Tax=Psychrilyobacter atlanticus TaxID=271091 RepID=UPI0004099656|nr:hypothetical protein [Psychrilyobacter atlanticus]
MRVLKEVANKKEFIKYVKEYSRNPFLFAKFNFKEEFDVVNVILNELSCPLSLCPDVKKDKNGNEIWIDYIFIDCILGNYSDYNNKLLKIKKKFNKYTAN